jgi:hypothetical protein
MSIWWTRVNVAVEVKNEPIEQGSSVFRETLIQVFGYLRQVLREQLDRRAAIALLVCKTDLIVWQADRSGVIGTANMINIHSVSTHTFCCIKRLLIAFERNPDSFYRLY